MDSKKAAEEVFKLVATKRGEFFRRVDRSSKGEPIILKVIHQSNGQSSPKQISELTGVSTARIAKVLGSLEKRNLIRREMDQEDRRKIHVFLTDAGKAHLKAFEEEKIERLKKVFEVLGEEETELFIHSLKKMLEAFLKVVNEEEDKEEEK
ncbi:MAG: winged helix DNA-binding protein [Streptococcaceae bacterium]|jgi:DNA-binding MarR family transcriptional regulator|nr:winged helix DNA-binding protein [Streptococcaceae bacterium]